MKASLPPNEDLRVETLRSYGILYTPPEQAFDDLAHLAALVCDVPIGVISFVDSHRQWFKAHIGLDVVETSRDTAFCAHAILGEQVMVVPDAALDERFHDNPLVTRNPGIRFYAGAPLIAPDGTAMGALCGLDTRPHQITAEQRDALSLVARQVVQQMQLRQAVVERKRSEIALSEAVSRAEDASRLKSHFVATMSHEIRTPLNGVIGMTGLLLNTELTPHQRELALMARNSGEALLTVINDILDFSRIEAGRLTIENTPFDLQTVVEEVTDILSSRAEVKGINLIVRYSEDAPRNLVGDAGRIRQIITNLVSNAVKFTNAGQVLIDVGCESRDNMRAAMRVVVEDTGIGIEQGKLEHIFNRFIQSEASTSRRYGGTGLGLAISRQLADLMGGGISVSSTVNEGSVFTFTVSLPVDSSKSSKMPFTVENLRNTRALIVNDNLVNCRVLEEYLANVGMRFESFTSGSAALTAMRESVSAGDPFRIALLDYHLPGMSGEDLGRIIQGDVMLKDTIPIVLISVGRHQDDQHGNESLYSTSLVKPIRQHQLIATMSNVLAGREPVDRSFGHTSSGQRSSAGDAGSINVQPTPYHALVVEDNVINQRVAKYLLDQMGVRVDVVANGQEGVRMFKTLPYDIIFMDCQMPLMDGFAATQTIREHEGIGARTPVVAMTAYAMSGDREKCLAAGMDDYIAKPIRSEELNRVMNKFLSIPGKAAKPPGADEEPNAVDIESLKERVDNDPGFLRELIVIFNDTRVAQMNELRQAIMEANADAIVETAHSMKGMLLSLSATPGAMTAREIESAGREGRRDGLNDLFEKLGAQLDAVDIRLNQLAESGEVK